MHASKPSLPNTFGATGESACPTRRDSLDGQVEELAWPGAAPATTYLAVRTAPADVYHSADFADWSDYKSV